MVTQLEVDFGSEGFIRDPYPTYEAIRDAGPVVWNATLNGWMLTGFDDCVTVLTDTGSNYCVVDDLSVLFWFRAPNMITVDGSEHHRLRDCVAGYFTRSAVARWERRVRGVVDELLEPLTRGATDCDLIGDFSRIPTVIVAELLGVPAERHDDFRRWSHIVTGNVGYGTEDPEVRRQMETAVRELHDYFAEEIERHRLGEFDDLLAAMLQMPEMSEAELCSTAVNFLLAGYDTTAKLMSIMLETLELHPDQRQLLVDDPSLITPAIEEVLRYVGVAQMIPRTAARDLTLRDTAIAKGDSVYCMAAAANRDPSRWSSPERLDVRRKPKSHLGFGFGPHLCIGAHLARLETRVAIERLLEIAPDYELRDVRYAPSFFVRGPERGIIQLAPAT